MEEYVDLEEKRKRIAWEMQYQEKPLLHGLPSPIVRKTSARYFAKVKGRTKEEILQLCEELPETGYTEERTIAFDWAFCLRKQYDPSDFDTFELWLKKRVHDWGACDDLCTHAFGAFIFQFPQFLPSAKEWAKSANRWMKRASAVVMIYSARRQTHLEEIFEMVDVLLKDPDVTVQKGYGWMLKEASKHYPKEVFNYVLKHRREMPRTGLRYAIEKLSPELKKEAMKKG